jgi:hypothetical protein
MQKSIGSPCPSNSYYSRRFSRYVNSEQPVVAEQTAAMEGTTTTQVAVPPRK